MLYYDFNDFEGFKERFGIQEHASGEKSRKNKILLAFIKDKERLHEAVQTSNYFIINLKDMSSLKSVLWYELEKTDNRDNSKPYYRVEVINKVLCSSQYETDECRGVCVDGDIRSIRYINHGSNDRIYKMKAGKFLRNIIMEHEFGKKLPEPVITYLMEEFTQDWQVYASQTLPENQLFVNKEFSRIYNSEYYAPGDFHSCMTNQDYDSFYRDAVEAQAAYLENDEGEIVARCIIFTNVHEVESDRVWRLAERQYAADGSDVLKRALVDALIRGGYIDGYKQIGAGCGDSRSFVDNKGESLSNKKFYIDCALGTDDPLSYQDSFKYYCYDRDKAYNYSGCGYDYDLASTDGSINGEQEYDDYHDYYCYETTCVMCDGREYYCDTENLDDFYWIDRVNTYYHKDDCVKCEDTDDWEVREEAWYSELIEEYYSTESAMLDAEREYKESNWSFSEFDNEYYEDDDDVVTYQKWDKQCKCYFEESIYIGTLINLVRNEVFFEYEGEVYNMLCHGKPMFLAA